MGVDASNRSAAGSAERKTRGPYVAPTLERLGPWSALTLQQSVPIGLFWDPATPGDRAIAARFQDPLQGEQPG